jgi:hypothetical protein
VLSTNRRVAVLALALAVAAAHWMVGKIIWRPAATAVKPNKTAAVRPTVMNLRQQAPSATHEAVVSVVGKRPAFGAGPATARSSAIKVGERAPTVLATDSLPATEVQQYEAQSRTEPSSTAASPSELLAPPRYAASTPESAQFEFVAMRGEQRLGTAVLDWQRQEDRYSLSMRVSDDATNDRPLMDQTSTGRVDKHGLQPERFVDTRRHRGARAVNLRCDEGVVSYSVSSAEHACVGGMQDSLSWWVQLAAIVSAMPARPEPGMQLQIAVARTHGTVDLWTFEVLGSQRGDQELAVDASNQIIRLIRRPGRMNRAYDTHAEVWLDAAAPHWPQRVQLQEARGEPLIWVRTMMAPVN